MSIGRVMAEIEYSTPNRPSFYHKEQQHSFYQGITQATEIENRSITSTATMTTHRKYAAQALLNYTN